MHIVLKATKTIKTKFNITEITNNVEMPQKSKDFIREYLNTDKLAEELEKDLVLAFDNDLLYAFDYLHNGKKLLIPEINPVLIFYSNAIMSHKLLKEFRETLFKKSPDVKNINREVDLKTFGNFFQVAVNSIINL